MLRVSMTPNNLFRHRVPAPRAPLLLALLLASACARGTMAGEITSPDTAPPERGTKAGPTAAPKPKHELVAFTWKSDGDATAGTIKTTLPDGEKFTGKFHEITRTTTVDAVGDVYGEWYGGPWAGPDWTWGDMFPYYSSTEEFITQYTGRAVATLTGDRGTKMRCHFRLDDPERGMKGGGHGECQLSSGERITTQFEPQ